MYKNKVHQWLFMAGVEGEDDLQSGTRSILIGFGWRKCSFSWFDEDFLSLYTYQNS